MLYLLIAFGCHKVRLVVIKCIWLSFSVFGCHLVCLAVVLVLPVKIISIHKNIWLNFNAMTTTAISSA